ncbi:hypothetical protein EZ313_04605 [Ramlibacter henchirensis]|uniref:Uncharacterized protein n=1 Tax=Ramlibacter henchirensis TaxID=204072 RepID=A0A4Z0C6E9_9BURK|nr:hypothetical protein [Ramlibacter henchirensis]TFZ05938.1 hypothetical protein EZ313_04605 [Ramlibacter henchirensis]
MQLLSAALPPCSRLVGAALGSCEGSALDHLLVLRPRLAAQCAASGIRIALLVRSGWIVAWLEGEARAVEESWGRFVAVKGFRGQHLLHRSEGPGTLRHPVQVAALSTPEPPGDAARQLLAVQRHCDPARVWVELCAPVRAGVDIAHGPLDVVLAGSGKNEAVDLLREYAHHHECAVEYQRFAGADERGADCGAAYADLWLRAARVRLHAHSQRSLRQDLARLALRQPRAWVLSLGGSPAASCRLAEGLVPLLESARPPAKVHLLPADADMMLHVTHVLRAVPGIVVRQGAPDGPPIQTLDDIADACGDEATPGLAQCLA